MSRDGLLRRVQRRMLARAHGWPASRFAIHYGVLMWAIPSALVFGLVRGPGHYVTTTLVTLAAFIPGGFLYGLALRRRINERIPPQGPTPG